MIIFGTTSTTKRVSHGEFHCPGCAARRPYALKRWSHLYWIPTIPTREVARWVECTACRGQYDPVVLAYDPEAEARAFEAGFQAASRSLLIRAALVDGEPGPRTLAALAQALGNLTRQDISADEVGREVEASRASAPAPSTAQLLSAVAVGLNEHGKEFLMRSLVHVMAAATGAPSAAAQALLAKVGRAVDMGFAHLRGVIAEASQRAA